MQTINLAIHCTVMAHPGQKSNCEVKKEFIINFLSGILK